LLPLYYHSHTFFSHDNYYAATNNYLVNRKRFTHNYNHYDNDRQRKYRSSAL